ncbi:MAG: NAD(P)-dependent oxidoreductase [Chloroflexota bacterium]
MNILVTGGLGVNGAWVTRQLREQGHKPVVYENRWDTSLLPDLVGKVEIVLGDILDLATVIRTIKEHKVQCICHLAALMPDQAEANPLMGFQVNALGTVNILEAARIMGVERVVYTSSKGAYSPFAGEYGYPAYKPVDEDYPKYPTHSVYGAGKVASELMAHRYHQKYGLDIIILRFVGIYAPGKKARHGLIAIHSKMIENAMLGRPTRIPRGGDEKDDVMYVKDVANSIVLACLVKDHKSLAFNIGTGRLYKLADFVEAIQKIYPEAVFEIGPGRDYQGREGRATSTYCTLDITKAREELGYRPQFGLEEGVRDYVDTMKFLGLEPVYAP